MCCGAEHSEKTPSGVPRTPVERCLDTKLAGKASMGMVPLGLIGDEQVLQEQREHTSIRKKSLFLLQCPSNSHSVVEAHIIPAGQGEMAGH